MQTIHKIAVVLLALTFSALYSRGPRAYIKNNSDVDVNVTLHCFGQDARGPYTIKAHDNDYWTCNLYITELDIDHVDSSGAMKHWRNTWDAGRYEDTHWTVEGNADNLSIS